MGSETLLDLFQAAQEASLAIDSAMDASADIFRVKGEALLKLARFALSESISAIRVGLKKEPQNAKLKACLDDALFRGNDNKVEMLMDKMDTGLEKCMRLVEEIRNTASKPFDTSLHLIPSRVPAIPPVRVLLISANTGSCFEAPELEQPFLKLLHSHITADSPDIAIVHFQEMCGKEWKDRDTKAVAAQFTSNLMGSLASGFYCPGMMFHPAFGPDDSSFTALATMAFVGKSLLDQDRLSIWDFTKNQQISIMALSESSTPATSDLSRFMEHTSFPSENFPEIKAGRKGFLHTRWLLDEVPIDIVNMHLFHDSSNLETFQQPSPSPFANARKRAFKYMLDHCSLATSNNVFVFGDFNFRLDLPKVVDALLDTTEFVKKPLGDKDGSLTLSNPKAGQSLILGKKRFEPHDPSVFVKNWSKFRQYDREGSDTPQSFNFSEYKVDFPPSYPYEEEVGHPHEYMTTRCPGWCDRVLMTQPAQSAVSAPVYSFLGYDESIGDHKPVFLSFKWQPHK
eukprot:c13277_g1_i1.p1 GENE.c13277_g1_i1~~c13277_g1_i1.p1  ORF type:complete len:533 (+),score=107.21 c13277_g1_i1:66-1601(+)